MSTTSSSTSFSMSKDVGGGGGSGGSGTGHQTTTTEVIPAEELPHIKMEANTVARMEAERYWRHKEKPISTHPFFHRNKLKDTHARKR